MSDDDMSYRLANLDQRDAAAVDAALALMRGGHAGAAPGFVPGANFAATSDSTDAARVARAVALLELMRQWPAEEPAADLTQRALSRIHDVEQRRRLAMQIDRLSGPAVAFRWRELMGVAAVVLIGLSVLWPVLAQTRSDARRIVCETRLSSAGRALASYAAENGGVMPRLATAPNANWATVGRNPAPGVATAGFGGGFTAPSLQAQSNPASLYLLARGGHIDPNTLACPDNAFAPRQMTATMHDWRNAREVSYSYQNQNTPQAIPLDATGGGISGGGAAVLADKNPIFMPDPNDPNRVIVQRMVSPTSATPFHRSAGQNILTTDGHVTWSTQPVIAGDNIWLIGKQRDYNLNESPPVGDAFLVP